MINAGTARWLPMLAVVALSALIGSAHAAGPSAPLPITPTSWISIATVAVLVVMTVAAMVYALSGAIGSPNARAWSRVQIYEALLSLIMILVFGSFSYLFFLNPQHAFGSLGLVPQGAGTTGCSSANDLFTLAVCDLSIFNQAAFNIEGVWYMLSYATGILPSIGITIAPIQGVEDVSFTFGPTSVVPLSSYIDLLTFIYSSTLVIMLLQQVQLLLLSSSILLLSLFVTLGLIARTFGFTRTFGGAMIAFGLGLGLVYPMLVAITYGYVDVQGNINCFVSTSCATGYSLLAVFGAFITLLTQFFGTIPATTISIFKQLGYMLAGFTFIPFLNFIIVDSFIMDFSSAIGERMDFMALLAGIV